MKQPHDVGEVRRRDQYRAEVAPFDPCNIFFIPFQTPRDLNSRDPRFFPDGLNESAQRKRLHIRDHRLCPRNRGVLAADLEPCRRALRRSVGDLSSGVFQEAVNNRVIEFQGMSPRFTLEAKILSRILSSILRLLLRGGRRLGGTDKLSAQPAVPSTSGPFADSEPLGYLGVRNLLRAP